MRLHDEEGKRLPYLPEKIDIFTLGMVLFWMAFLSAPFKESTTLDKQYKYICQDKKVDFFKTHYNVINHL